MSYAQHVAILVHTPMLYSKVKELTNSSNCQNNICNSGETESLATRMMNCIDDVSDWMSSNRLKINPTLTEFL